MKQRLHVDAAHSTPRLNRVVLLGVITMAVLLVLAFAVVHSPWLLLPQPVLLFLIIVQAKRRRRGHTGRPQPCVAGQPAITALTHAHPEFGSMLGPYLDRRDVAHFVDGATRDDDRTTWLVARRGDQLQGFCSVRPRDQDIVIETVYLTDADDRATLVRLVTAAVDWFGRDAHLCARVRQHYAYAYQTAGFARVAFTLDGNVAVLSRLATSTQHRSA